MTTPGTLPDGLGRPLRNLRVSVTDRCNLRCQYCMPEEEYVWLRRQDLLTFEEIRTLVEVFTGLGVDKVRLTGGEPLVRRDLPVLVRLLAENPAIGDLAMTTNGVMLASEAQALRAAGLGRVTVSLDTLSPERFQKLTRRDTHRQVLAGIAAARAAGFPALKLDTVVMRGVNEDELPDLVEYGRRVGAEVRFIEYMDVGGATHWSLSQVVSRAEMLAALGRRYGAIEPVPALAEESAAPAERFRLSDGTVFGIIASTTAPFCRRCDRSRLTADGTWYLCLYAQRGIDLRTPLRDGASRQELRDLIAGTWMGRRDRGAEERRELEARGVRGVLVQIDGLRQDPRLEMHTRGGSLPASLANALTGPAPPSRPGAGRDRGCPGTRRAPAGESPRAGTAPAATPPPPAAGRPPACRRRPGPTAAPTDPRPGTWRSRTGGRFRRRTRRSPRGARGSPS
jgi:cyclic pyranopterin phosphate synthase